MAPRDEHLCFACVALRGDGFTLWPLRFHDVRRDCVLPHGHRYRHGSQRWVFLDRGLDATGYRFLNNHSYALIM